MTKMLGIEYRSHITWKHFFVFIFFWYNDIHQLECLPSLKWKSCLNGSYLAWFVMLLQYPSFPQNKKQGYFVLVYKKCSGSVQITSFSLFKCQISSSMGRILVAANGQATL